MRRVAVAASLWAVAVAACSPAIDDAGSGSTSSTAPAPVITTSSAPTTAESSPDLNPYGGSVVTVGWGDVEESSLDNDPVSHLARDQGWHIRRLEQDRWLPGLLSEIPSLQNGGLRLNQDGTMTVRYEIHPDAAWEDGTPITGEDFAFTYEFVMANFDELAEIADFNWANPTWRLEFPNLDPTSFVVEDKAFAYTLPATRHWAGLFSMVVPKHQVETTDLTRWLETPTNWYAGAPWEDWYLYPPVVVGPSGWPEMTFVRNDRYWVTDAETGQGLPYFDEKRWILAPDQEAAWEYFLATPEADHMPYVVTSETIDDIVANDLIVVPQGGNFEHIGFNFGPGRFEVNPDSLLEHLAFRQAIAHALDRQRIAEQLYGGLINAIDSYVSEFSPSVSTGAWSRYDYDPARARALLDELCTELERDCATKPPTLVLSSDGFEWHTQTAEQVRQMLGEVGIEVTLDTHDNLGEVFDAGYEAILVPYVLTPGLDDLIAIHESFAPGSDFDIYAWGADGSAVQNDTTERYVEIVDQMVSTFDESELPPLIAEAEQILADNVVFIPLFPQGWADFWKPGRINGSETQVGPNTTWETFYRTDLGGAARYEP